MVTSFLGNVFEFLIGFFIINFIFNLIEIGFVLFLLPYIGIVLSLGELLIVAIVIKIILFTILLFQKKVMAFGFLIGFILDFLII